MLRVLPSWRIVMVVALTLGYMVLGVTLGGGSLVLAGITEDAWREMLTKFGLDAGTLLTG